MSVSILVKKCLEGDGKAWNELMELITPIILATCRKADLTHEESCDVFGRVSYLLLKKLENLRSADSIFSYIGSIARNEAMMIYRKSEIEKRALGDVLKTMYDFNPDLPDEIFEKSKRFEKLMEAVSLLPRRQSQVLRMLYFDANEPDYKEIAEKLNMPVSSVGPTRARGLARMYRILKQKRFKF